LSNIEHISLSINDTRHGKAQQTKPNHRLNWYRTIHRKLRNS